MPSKKRAIAELTADDRGFQRGMARAEKRMSTLGRLSKETGKAMASVGTKVLAGAFGGAALAGTAMLANEGRKTIEFENQLTRLGITARGALGPLDAFRSKVFAVSTATGVAREDVLGAATAFVALTGDGKAAVQSLDLFARVGKGTGASMDDIAASAAAMTQNLQIAPADLEKAFSIMIAGGKAGSVELKDMAGLLASLAPLAATFAGGSGVGGLADLSAGLQLARQGFGSASEAATGLEALMGSVARRARQLKSGGVEVFSTDKNGKKSLKGFQEIVEAIGNSKLANNPTLLIKALGSKEAYQAFLQLVKVKGAWSDLSDETLKANDTAQDFARFQASSAGQMQTAMNSLKNAVAETFTPSRIEAFALAIKGAVGFLSGLVDGLGRVSQIVDSMTGGDSTDVAKGEQDDWLNSELKKGKSLDQIEKEANDLNWFDSIGGVDESRKEAVARRRGMNKHTERKDRARWIASPTIAERENAAFSYNNDMERDTAAEAAKTAAAGPQIFRVDVGLDRNANLKTRVDEHPGHAQR